MPTYADMVAWCFQNDNETRNLSIFDWIRPSSFPNECGRCSISSSNWWIRDSTCWLDLSAIIAVTEESIMMHIDALTRLRHHNINVSRERCMCTLWIYSWIYVDDPPITSLIYAQSYPWNSKLCVMDIVLVYWLDLMGGRWRLDVMLSMMMCCFLWDWSFCQLVAFPFWTRLVLSE